MLTRVVFIFLTLFWLTMNALLWRAEFGARGANGNAVPAELVWQKILTAPDSSSLIILHHGTRIGICHWITSVGEEWATVSDENLPDGAPGRARSYGLRFEGSAMLQELTNRVRFEAGLKLSSNQDWQELDARVLIRPLKLEIHFAAADRAVRIRLDTGDLQIERVFKPSDLQNPAVLLGELPMPVAGRLLAEMELSPRPQNASLNPGLKWEAREDDLRVGHTPVRIYRLQTRLLDRYAITIYVSRVGEILRVELPDDLVLANDQLTTL